jgi:hypothetical protein
MFGRKNTLTRAQVDQLLGNVATEMALAGGQVLRDQFGFSSDQIKTWLDATTARAQKNREGSRG